MGNSMTINVSTESAKEKLYGASLKQKRQQPSDLQQDQIAKQQPNNFTGLQWATLQQNPNAVQQTNTAEKPGLQNSAAKSTSPELMAQDIEDIAILSSAVTLSDESVAANNKPNTLPELAQAFKDIYKKTKSHNLLLERFISGVKLSGMNLLLSISGMPPEKIDEIKAQVRNEALKEIDTKLSQDWAYTKAMLDIMGKA